MHFCLLILLILLTAGCTSPPANPTEFRLHLFTEPQHLDPTQSRSSNSSYFFMSVMRGLYKFTDDRGIQPEGGNCTWENPRKVVCVLAPDHQWANGEPVVSADYVRAFRHLVDPATASPRADLLLPLENCEAILNGQLPPEKLGISEISKTEFSLQFAKYDPYFLTKLTSTALFPKHRSNPEAVKDYKNFVGTGPYKIDDWRWGQWLTLKPNPYYGKGHPQRPPVRFYIVDSDFTALRLYQQGQLDLLQRLPTNLITLYKDRPDFLQIPMARFDYLGFGGAVPMPEPLRQALALSLDYHEFAKLLKARGRPGCPSIPASWFDRQPCLAMDLPKAKKLVAASPLKHRELTLAFSQMGGEDVAKIAEWLEHQWKKNLGLKIRLRPMERKSFLRQLKTAPPDIFHKGVGIDLPICFQALATFGPDSPQNFSHFADPEYQTILAQLGQTADPAQQKVLCRRAMERLLAKHWIIPLGEIHFTMLAQPRFTGWRINGMNQLDLSQLQVTPGPKN